MADNFLARVTLRLPDNVHPGLADRWFNRQLKRLKEGAVPGYPRVRTWDSCQVFDDGQTMVVVYRAEDAHDRNEREELLAGSGLEGGSPQPDSNLEAGEKGAAVAGGSKSGKRVVGYKPAGKN